MLCYKEGCGDVMLQLVLALYPQTTCFYRAVIHEPPKRVCAASAASDSDALLSPVLVMVMEMVITATTTTIIRLHRMHEMLTIVTDVHSVCQSVCH